MALLPAGCGGERTERTGRPPLPVSQATRVAKRRLGSAHRGGGVGALDFNQKAQHPFASCCVTWTSPSCLLHPRFTEGKEGRQLGHIESYRGHLRKPSLLPAGCRGHPAPSLLASEPLHCRAGSCRPCAREAQTHV